MAQLNKDKAEAAANAETTSFDPVPPDTYHLRLRDVDATRSGPAGPYWSWEFEIVGGDHAGRRLWNNTSLADNAMWKLKETFDAFGADTNADTDDLCGQVVKGVVSQRTIQAGNRKGELGNQIDRLSPADEEFSAGSNGAGAAAGGGSGRQTAGAAAGGGGKGEDIF